MITRRNINRIIIGIVVLTLAFTTIFTYSPETLQIKSRSSKEYMNYENMLFTEDRVMTIDIIMDEKEFNYMLDNAMDEVYYRCDVNVNGTTFYNVGIRPKGNSSLFTIAMDNTTNRYSFKLEFDHYQDGQTCYGLDKMALNNVMGDSTYMKEYLSYDIMRSVDVAAPLNAFADIKVNGEDWGFYFAVEGIEESFAERNFGKDYGNMYKPEADMFGKMEGVFDGGGDMEQMQQFANMGDGMNFEDFDFSQMEEMLGVSDLFGKSSNLTYIDDNIESYEDIIVNEVFKGTTTDYKRLINAIKMLNEGEYLEDCVDIDPVLRYFAANSVVVSLDSYVGVTQHNYYLYEKDGKLTIIPWDYNYSFGAFGCSLADSMVNYPIDSPVQGGKLEERPLLGKLLENEEYLALYHKYHQDILDDYFYNGNYEMKIRSMDALISEYVKKDASAFFSYDEYKKGVENLITLGNLRVESIQGQLDGSIPSTTEGQESNPEALVKTDSVDYASLGNSADLANKFANTTPADGNEVTSVNAPDMIDNNRGDVEAFSNKGDVKAPEQIPPSSTGEGFDQNMRMNEMNFSFLQKDQDQSSGVSLIFSSFIALLLGIFFVRYYNRRI